MDTLQIQNKEIQKKFEDLFYFIDNGLLTEDDQIIDQINQALKELQMEDKKEFLKYVNLVYTNHSFLVKGQFIQDGENCKQRLPDQDFKQLYKELKSKEKYEQILQLLKNEKFCLANNFSRLIYNNTSILQKLGKKTIDLLNLIDLRSDKEVFFTINQFDLLKILLDFFFCDYLNEKDQIAFEQIVGSLLVNEIYQFQYHIDKIEERNPQQFQQFVQCIQIRQMQQGNVNLKETIGQFNKDIKNLYKLLTQDIANTRKKILNKFKKKFQIKNSELGFQLIIENFESKIIAQGRSEIQEFYFMLIWHYLVQYSKQFKVLDEINQLAQKLQKVKDDQKRIIFLLQISLDNSKNTKDRIFQFVTHRYIYFTGNLIDVIEIDKYFQYKKLYQESQDIFQTLKCQSIKQLLAQPQSNFLKFWQVIRGLEHEYLVREENKDNFNKNFILMLWATKNDILSYERIFLIFKLTNLDLDCCKQLIEIQFRQSSITFQVNWFNIAAQYHRYDQNVVQMMSKLTLQVNCSKSVHILLKFKEIIENKNRTYEQIQWLSDMKLIYWGIIKQIYDHLTLENFLSGILQFYFNNLKLNFYPFYTIFQRMFLIVDIKQNSQLLCFKLLIKNVSLKLLHFLFLMNRKEKIKLPCLKISVFTFLGLLSKHQEPGFCFLFSNIKYLISHKFYNLELIYSLKNKQIEDRIIYNLIQAIYYFDNKDMDSLLKICQVLFLLNKKQYQDILAPLNYFDVFEITPQMLKKYYQKDLYPIGMNIDLEEFNISLTKLTDKELDEVVTEWGADMADQIKFRKLIPLFFNIIKRGESAKQLLSVIHSQNNQQNQVLLNLKAIFQILYNNSNDELQVMLLKFHSQQNPVPLIYQNPIYSSIKKTEDMYVLNHNIFYVFPTCYTIINFSFHKSVNQIGKTFLLNKIFYQKKKFEICDTCDLNLNTIDIMFDVNFNGSRNFSVADLHGQVPVSILLKILPLFRLWIIQVDSEVELKDCFEQIQFLKQNIQVVSIKICIIVRNAIQESQQRNLSIINKIQLNNINIHFIQDLTKKGLDQLIQQNEIEKVSIFIFQLIEAEQSINNFMNQNHYLEIEKEYENLAPIIRQQQEEGFQIIKLIEQELDVQIASPQGFFNQNCFPLRSIDFQIKNKRDELSLNTQSRKEQQTACRNTIKQEIEDLQKQITKQKQTLILELFCSIFDQKNYYILYFCLVDKLRKYNLNKTYQLQNDNQKLNEKIQELKKSKKNVKEKNEPVQAIEQIKFIQDQINDLNKLLERNLKTIQQNNIGVELFWREIILQKQHCPQSILNINPVEKIYEMIHKGEPFEFLDGDQLQINCNFLQKLTEKFEQKGSERILVFSILGPQSSGKSTILNQIFGCHFWTSVGRCTKGIYLQLLKVHNQQQFHNLFDYVLLLDTEGLQNPNQQDPEFDKKIALFVLAISDIVLINVRGDINQQFRNLVEMCIYTLGQMKSNFSFLKQLSWCFNQNNNVNNKDAFLQQIQDIANNLNAELTRIEIDDQDDQKQDYCEILDIKKENIAVLGFSAFEKSWKSLSNASFSQMWRQLNYNQTFSSEAYAYGIRTISMFVEKFRQQSQNNEKSLENFNYFIQNITLNWESIQRLPDLLEFTELIQHQQNKFMKDEFDKLYQRQDQFIFMYQIKNKISRAIESTKKKSLKYFQQIQDEEERSIDCQFEIIKKSISDSLQQVKQQKKISKKICEKYERQLEQNLISLKCESKMWILDEIKNHERQYQTQEGFISIEIFLDAISSDPSELARYQNDPHLTTKIFEQLWYDIMSKLNEEKQKVFDEFQVNWLKSILQANSQFTLKTDHDQRYFAFFKKINKNDPIQNLQEKSQIFQQWQREISIHHFQYIFKTLQYIRYLDIFHLSLQQKFALSTKDDFVDIRNYFDYAATWEVIDKTLLDRYFETEFLKDLMKVFKNCEKKKCFTQIYNFFILLNHFNLKYDKNLFNKLISAITNPIYLQLKSWEQQIKDAYSGFSKTLSFDKQQEIIINDQQFQMNFWQVYSGIKIQYVTQNFRGLQELANFRRNLLHQNIILSENQQFQPIKDSTELKYIMNPQTQNGQFSKLNLCVFVHDEMYTTGGWEKLYFKVYEIIEEESKIDGSRILNDSSDNYSDDENSTFSNSQIRGIMSKIEQEIVNFNKQFAKFGVILGQLGERVIFYYSVLIIWRFGCYRKWNTLQRKWKLQSDKANEFEKFKAEVTKNKAQQSKHKAKTLVDSIYQGFIDQFYKEKSSIAANQIQPNEISSTELVRILDEQLLQQYSDQGTISQQNNKVVDYIKNQRKYINDYVNEEIKALQQQLKVSYEQILKTEIASLLNDLLMNSQLIQMQVMDHIKTKEYFNLGEQQDGYYEKKLYQIIIACLQGMKNLDLNHIDESYRYIFQQKYKLIQRPIITKIQNDSDQEVQQLFFFISEVVVQFQEKLRNINQLTLNFSSLNITSKLDEKKLKMQGCQFSCPMCKRKCDLDDTAHSKHECRNGHYLRGNIVNQQFQGMNGVLIEDKPSLFTCEEIDDEAEITTFETQIVKTWREVRRMYPEWQFQSLNDLQKHKDKMIKVWNNGVGQLLCDWFSNQLQKPVGFLIKHELDQLYQNTQHIHYIMVLDDSGSMSGNRWQNVKNGAVACMADLELNPNAKVSVIIFNSTARIVLDCVKVDIKTQHEQIKYSGGGTVFKEAFKAIFESINKEQNSNFQKIIILFYTDGGAEYPEEQVQRLSNLPKELKQKITLIACTETQNATVLSKIVQGLKSSFYRADLKTCIQTSAVRQTWCEIVSQNYHKLRC